MAGVRAAAGVVLLLAGAAAAAGFGDFPADGWYSWRVAAVEPAPAWCCRSWKRDRVTSHACDLVDGNHGYSDIDRPGNDCGEMQIYVRIVNNRAARIRTLSPACPIRAPAGIEDLGLVDTAASLRWLEQQLGGPDQVAEDALAAISTHRGDEAADLLIRTGRTAASAELRGEAWFWLAQSAAAGSEAAIFRAISDDKDYDVREEAVYALSELPGERAVQSLIAVLENRALDHALREEALFWLAQTESEVAYRHIERLLFPAP